MDTRSLRLLTAAALVLAPALFLVGTLLHPKEYGDGQEAEQLVEIADAYTRWQLAHALAFVATVVFAAAVAGLAFLVGRGRPGEAAPEGSARAGLAGGALGIAGLIGVATVVTIDGFSSGILGEVSSFPSVDERSLQVVLTGVRESNWALIYSLTPIAFVLGLVVLTVAAVRRELVAAWAGVLLVLGALASALQVAIASNAYFIASAALLLLGGAAAATSLASGARDA